MHVSELLKTYPLSAKDCFVSSVKIAIKHSNQIQTSSNGSQVSIPVDDKDLLVELLKHKKPPDIAPVGEWCLQAKYKSRIIKVFQ